MTIRFVVYGEAQPAGSKRAFVPKGWTRPVVTDANPKAKIWKEQIAREAARALKGEMLPDGPVRLEVLFYRVRPKGHFTAQGVLRGSAPSHPTTKPDTTKLLRGIEDALTGIAWRDDAQVCEQLARKEFGEPARVEIRMEPMRPAVQTSAKQLSLTGESA